MLVASSEAAVRDKGDVLLWTTYLPVLTESGEVKCLQYDALLMLSTPKTLIYFCCCCFFIPLKSRAWVRSCSQILAFPDTLSEQLHTNLLWSCVIGSGFVKGHLLANISGTTQNWRGICVFSVGLLMLGPFYTSHCIKLWSVCAELFIRGKSVIHTGLLLYKKLSYSKVM